MRIALTNLSNELFETSRSRLNKSARKFGIDEIYSYDFDDIKNTSFYLDNREILDQPKGLGYWLWKPYIILETIKCVADGDIVVYSDCGIEIVADISPIVNICLKDQQIVLFANGNLVNSSWTKRDCFVLMNSDNEYFWESIQCDAAFIVLRKSRQTVEFLNEWLNFCKDKRILTDLPNTCGRENLRDFIEHRRDQSVLSILAIKYKIPFFRIPTQFGNHYKTEEYRVKNEFNCVNQRNQKNVRYYSKNPFLNSPYAQLLDHHRAPIVNSVQKISFFYRVIEAIKKTVK